MPGRHCGRDMAARRGGNGGKSGSKRGAESEPADAAPHYLGHRERLRTRFREAGTGAVTDYELLELVLFRAIPRRDLKPLCKDLVAKFGSFAEVLAAPEKRLAEIKGLGDAAIVKHVVGQLERQAQVQAVFA